MQDAKKEGVRDMYGRVKRTFQTYKELLLLGLLGIPIGLVVGGIDAVFGRVLLAITDFRNGIPCSSFRFWLWQVRLLLLLPEIRREEQ